VTAKKTEKARMERRSSKTAAPNRLKPTWLRKRFSSIKVRAEMLTLVAAMAIPKRMAAV
jgi:hypothetical protein